MNKRSQGEPHDLCGSTPSAMSAGLDDGSGGTVRRGDLIHYSDKPLGRVRSVAQKPECDDGRWYTHEKPRGLWVSVLGQRDWASWCRAESFRSTRRQHAARLHLTASAKVLQLRSASDLDAFTQQYGEEWSVGDGRWKRIGINWQRVAADHDGLIIAPYVWSRRLHDVTGWYYGWDCASGCIWSSAAIARVEALRTPAAARERSDTGRIPEAKPSPGSTSND